MSDELRDALRGLLRQHVDEYGYDPRCLNCQTLSLLDHKDEPMGGWLDEMLGRSRGWSDPCWQNTKDTDGA